MDHIFNQLNQFCAFPCLHSAPNRGIKQKTKEASKQTNKQTGELHKLIPWTRVIEKLIVKEVLKKLCFSYSGAVSKLWSRLKSLMSTTARSVLIIWPPRLRFSG